MKPTQLYRYEDVHYAAPLNEYDEPSGPGTIKVELRTYKVIKHTPKGCWIDIAFGLEKRFVNLSSRKRFACPTIEEAKESFVARKTRQVNIYSFRLKRAKMALDTIQNPDTIDTHTLL